MAKTTKKEQDTKTIETTSETKQTTTSTSQNDAINYKEIVEVLIPNSKAYKTTDNILQNVKLYLNILKQIVHFSETLPCFNGNDKLKFNNYLNSKTKRLIEILKNKSLNPDAIINELVNIHNCTSLTDALLDLLAALYCCLKIDLSDPSQSIQILENFMIDIENMKQDIDNTKNEIIQPEDTYNSGVVAKIIANVKQLRKSENE